MLSRREMGALCASLLFCLLLSLGAGWAQSQLTTANQLAADTLRLHIRADTDSVRDQSAKLAVRDAVLVLTDEACPADSRADARAWAAENLVRFELTARQTLASLGIRAPVKGSRCSASCRNIFRSCFRSCAKRHKIQPLARASGCTFIPVCPGQCPRTRSGRAF